MVSTEEFHQLPQQSSQDLDVIEENLFQNESVNFLI